MKVMLISVTHTILSTLSFSFLPKTFEILGREESVTSQCIRDRDLFLRRLFWNLCHCSSWCGMLNMEQLRGGLGINSPWQIFLDDLCRTPSSPIWRKSRSINILASRSDVTSKSLIQSRWRKCCNTSVKTIQCWTTSSCYTTNRLGMVCSCGELEGEKWEKSSWRSIQMAFVCLETIFLRWSKQFHGSKPLDGEMQQSYAGMWSRSLFLMDHSRFPTSQSHSWASFITATSNRHFPEIIIL